jgi:8-oxo-dGTP pyrophosphatase MutT (NUDIX family)
MPSPVSIEAVKHALQAPLPGLEAQRRMATRPRTSPDALQQGRPPRLGAVLILLYPFEGQLCLPLTRRTERVETHKGQISLPGGGFDEGDASFWHTALREAHEELAVDAGQVEYIAALSPLYIPPSNFDVHPFIGYIPSRPAFVPYPDEVAELIEMPLQTLLDPAAKVEETWTWRGREMQVPFYRYQQHVIWGATAMILSEFEALLAAELGMVLHDTSGA